MRLLTPSGYRDVSDCRVGDEVVAFDPGTGELQHNLIEEIEYAQRPVWQPYSGTRLRRDRRRQQEWLRQQQELQDGFCWYRVNGRHVLFANQSVWADDNVTHAKLLSPGQTIYLDDDSPELVESVERIEDGLDTWVRFRISGDHSYVLDGLTLHNASRFWVGGTANWDASTTTNWSVSSGGLGGASVPTSSDDVSFDILSNTTAYTVTITATANCRDMTWALPSVSGVPTLTGTQTLNIFGNFTLIATQLWSLNATLQFSATTTGKTVTTAGVNLTTTTVTFVGSGGGWTLQDALSMDANKTIAATNGTLNTNGKTVTCGFFVSTSGTRTLTLDNSTINITGTSGSPWNVQTAGTLTFSATGSTINYSGGTVNATTNFQAGTTAALVYGTVNITAVGTVALNANNVTFKNLSYTSSTDKRDALSISAAFTIGASGSLSIAGNSVVNRAFLLSSILGTQRTITVPNTATVSLTNVDFQDVASAGTFGTWTGTSLGDALGNSGITFDASVTLTLASTGTINWSSATWTSSGAARTAPLPQDDVVLPSLGSTTNITVDMPRTGRNITATSFNRQVSFTSVPSAVYGNFTLGASVLAVSNNQGITFSGRGAQTLTTAGVSIGSVFVAAFGGTYTLQDNYTSTGSFTLSNGTWAGQAFDFSTVNFQSTSGSTRAISGSGVWSVTSAAGIPWNVSAAGLTVSGFTGTIKYTGNITTTATFAGAGLTWPNLWWSNTAATGTLIITGANTFNNFKVDGTTGRTVQFPAGVTTTVSTWNVSGADASHLISITSSSPGTPATLSKASGSVSSSFVSIKDSTATGGATWRAGATSTNVSGNTGWVFTASAVAQLSSVTSPEAVTLGRSNRGKFVSVAQAQTWSLLRSVAHRISVTQVQLMGVFRSAPRLISVAQAELLSVLRNEPRLVSVLQTNMTSLRNSVSKLLSAGTQQLLSALRGADHIILAAHPELASVARSTGRFISVAQAELLSVVRSAVSSLTSTMGQVVSLSRRTSAALSVELGSAVSCIRGYARVMVVSGLLQLLTIVRGGGVVVHTSSPLLASLITGDVGKLIVVETPLTASSLVKHITKSLIFLVTGQGLRLLTRRFYPYARRSADSERQGSLPPAVDVARVTYATRSQNSQGAGVLETHGS